MSRPNETLQMYKFSGGPPWVFADNAEEAKRIAGEEYGNDQGDPVQMTDAELFTITFYTVPDGLKPDIKCDCTEDEIDDGVCDCEGKDSVTMTVKEWCNEGSKHLDERVIWEFEG